MKKRVNLFDVCLLVLVVLLGLGAYAMSHEDPPAPPDSAEPLLSDIRRNSDRYTDPEVMAETENYVIEYRVLLEQGDPDYYEALASTGDTILDSYKHSLLGTLKGLEVVEVNGEPRVVATLELFSVFTKTSVASPGGNIIRVGAEYPLITEDETYLGMGTILWISH